MSCDCAQGILLDQSYGECRDPGPFWIPIQRCDTCCLYESDEAAAKALKRRGHLVQWVEPLSPDLQGDWFYSP